MTIGVFQFPVNQFEIVVVNHYLMPLNITERLTAATSGAMLFAFLITDNYIFTLGFVLFIAMTLWQLRGQRFKSIIAQQGR